MKKKLRIFTICMAVFLLATTLSIYSYCLFARQAQGQPSYALPVQPEQTLLDRTLTSHLQNHPGETGLILLNNNLDAFMVRALSAREAGRSLDLQYYIWRDDLTGVMLAYELLSAADRGVRVRMLLDDMTAHDRSSMLAALDTHPLIEIRLFNPTRARDTGLRRGIEMLLRLVSVNRRMHNKAWIADGRLAIVGGRNISDEYFGASLNTNFFDVDLLLAGHAVAETSHIFDDFWNSPAALPLSALVTAAPDSLDNLRADFALKAQSIAAQPYVQQLLQSPSTHALYNGERTVYWTPDVHVYSDPAQKVFGQGQSQWLIHTLLPLWDSATQDFKIISPYFVPSTAGIDKFRALRQRGANIDILTNSLAATDVLASHSGYAPYRKPLLDMGVNLFELRPFGEQEQHILGSSSASLHTKAFLINQQIGFVGSFNFDPRSVRLNTEMGVVFTQPTIVAQLIAEFTQRTSAPYSYQVVLQNGSVRWNDVSEQGQIRIWTHEPQTTWWERTLTRILGWLPIESQL